MSLGDVYIVLEPVGSARLTFDDDRYYEFMCFDVPKVVRSPTCDHGHDKESRNGRDMNIDILEGYVWTPEWFQISSGKLLEYRGLPEPPGESMGLNGPWWERQGGDQVGAPPKPNPNWVGGRPPFPFSFSLFLLFLVGLGKGESYSY